MSHDSTVIVMIVRADHSATYNTLDSSPAVCRLIFVCSFKHFSIKKVFISLGTVLEHTHAYSYINNFHCFCLIAFNRANVGTSIVQRHLTRDVAHQ
jgi:hypothetical protein